jgi:hypothetical protein
VKSVRYASIWSFPAWSRSRLVTPMKSVSSTPNWSCACCQGSRFNGAGNRSGSARGSTPPRLVMRCSRM